MEFNIKDIFQSVAKQMRIDFEESRLALNHPTLKGDSAEEIVKNFLNKYFTKNLSITSGLIIDSNGKFSKQQDIIICDADKTPILYEKKDIRVVPVETVYAVIEVKSKLKKNSIPSIIDNALSVKNMEKKAFYTLEDEIIKTNFNLYGKKWDYYPINYFVFAFEAEDSSKIANEIWIECLKRNLPIEKRIDCCCILNEYVFLNAIMDNNDLPESVDALPSEKTQFRSYPTNNSLLLFYTMISNYLFQASCKPFRLRDYLRNMVF